MRQFSISWNIFRTLIFSLFVGYLAVCLPIPVHALNCQLLLLDHDGNTYRACWASQGRFARLLEKKQRMISAIPTLELSSGFEKSHFARLSRKLKVPLYPSLVLKPFILVEELKWALERHQAKRIKTPVDENFQLTGSSAAKLDSSQKTSSQKTRKEHFLFSPYYRRLYGLHVEFQW